MSERQPGAGTRVAAGLIGREDVLALMKERWSEAQLGSGSFLLLSGEAGIGKTRMLQEIGAALGDPPTITTRAWPRDAEVPGAVLVELARAMRHAGDTEQADSLLDRLLAVEESGDASRRRRLLVGDLADLVLARISDRPGLLQLEDLHWADELSLEVLERVAPLVPRTPSLVIATYRSDEFTGGGAVDAWRTRMLRQRTAEEVRLGRLDELGTARLADALTGEMVSREFVAQLHERSNGIPLHIEELIAAGGTDAVPDTVGGAVRQRTAKFDDTIRGIVGAAAVIGCSFEFDLLTEVAEEEPDEVDRALRALLDDQLMVSLSPTRFDFRHALIRDALYEELPPHRRRTLHEAVAVTSEQHHSGRLAYLSEHYELANLAEPAHRHALTAARAASTMSAHREAAELFERALRTVPPDAGPAVLADLHAALATELAAVDRPRLAAEHYSIAIDLYREAGDTHEAVLLSARLMGVRHLLGDELAERLQISDRALTWLDALPTGGSDVIRARLLGAIASAYLVNDRLDDAIETAQQALDLAPNDLDIQTTLGATLVFAGDDEGWSILQDVLETARAQGREADTVRAIRMLATSASELVEYARARIWLDEGLEYTASIERWNDHHYLRAHRAHVRWATGGPGAERDARRALADGRGITTEIQARVALGFLRISDGRFDAAREHLERALQLGREMRELQRIAPAMWGLAEIAVHEGAYRQAIDLAEEVFAMSVEVSEAAGVFPFVLTGTRALLGLRDTAGARDWLERTGAHLRKRSVPGTMPSLDHAEGLVLYAESSFTGAREHLERARDAWVLRERRWEHIQSLIDLARCAVRNRRPGEAARLAAEAKDQAAEAGMTLLAGLADTLKLDPAADPSSGPLTARELEVAKLVAGGATNREIAEQLVIAPKTASAHVEHILAKLGMSRRAEIAAWVSRN